MKKYISTTQLSFILLSAIFLPGCKAIGEIFKAGMWTGVIFVVLIIGIVLYLISRSSKK